MSMRDYAVEDYGIVLRKDDLKRICAKIFSEEFTEDDWETDPYGFIESLQDRIDLCSCGDFTGEAIAIGRDGRDQYWNSITFSGESLYYVAIRKYPTLFKGAYECFDDMVDDFKIMMSEYTSEDFDFTNVRHIVGTYFG